jgi:leader peptidase (prepilin peptidase)/N-methyltransferase
MTARSRGGVLTFLAQHRLTLVVMAGGVALSLYLLPQPAASFAALLAALAIFIAVIDIEQFIIPDSANLAMFVSGLVLAVAEAPRAELWWAMLDAAGRAAASGAVLLALRYFYSRRSGVEGLGLGDAKLAAAGAAWLAWPQLPVALLIAAFGGLLAVGTQAAIRRTMPSRRAELPFGAFVAPAIWLAFSIGRIEPCFP